VKALKNDLKIEDIDINYHVRLGETKLRSFRDGWRHLRFMLLYSPLFLFFIPGIFLFLIGLFSMLQLYFSTITLLGIQLYIHPMFVSAMFILVGYQLIMFSAFSRIYAVTHLKDKSKFLDKMIRYLTIERASIFGGLVVIAGILIYLVIFLKWLNTGFGDINEIKNSILSLTFIVLGVQTIAASFMMSIIGIGER
ncbi:glycosyltransferase family 2 protein, partial [archaeon]|nr:glycosyltransferase family 2 protein [archaeon]